MKRFGPLALSQSPRRLDCPDFRVNENGTVPFAVTKLRTVSRRLLIVAVALLVASVPVVAALAEPSPEPSSSSPALKLNSPAARDPSPPKPDSLSPAALVGSLALVIGVFLLAMWLLRRASPRGGGLLPAEAFESLGRAPLGYRRQAQLLRVGNKLALISVSVTEVEPLVEITDPAEVERLTELCRRSPPSVAPAPSLGRLFRRKEGHDAK